MKLGAAFLIGLVVVLFSPTVTAADIYVAENGSDAWSGRLPEPKGDDGPFATLKRARDAVRELKAKGAGGDITVQIRGGSYQLDETVVFGLEDSGADDFSITYEAFPGEKRYSELGPIILERQDLKLAYDVLYKISSELTLHLQPLTFKLLISYKITPPMDRRTKNQERYPKALRSNRSFKSTISN